MLVESCLFVTDFNKHDISENAVRYEKTKHYNFVSSVK